MVRFPRSWDEPYVRDPDDNRGAPPRRASPRPRRASSRDKPDLETTLAAAGSPRQQELAQRIYARLKAGAQAEDIQDLISDLAHTAGEQIRRSLGSVTQPRERRS